MLCACMRFIFFRVRLLDLCGVAMVQARSLEVLPYRGWGKGTPTVLEECVFS